METIQQTLEIDVANGRMQIEAFRPDVRGPLPGVLLLMDAFGVDAHLKSVARRLAAEGYVVLTPDLYYRESERTIPYSSPDRAADRVMRTIALSDAPEERVKDERVLADISSALGALTEHSEVDPARVGVLGFGMGGRLAFLTACRMSEQVRAAVVFYAGRMVPVLSEARELRAPLLLLFGGRDRAIPFAHVDRIQAELGYLGKPHELKVYPLAESGFFCDPHRAFHAESAEDAWLRTRNWFGKHLG